MTLSFAGFLFENIIPIFWITSQFHELPKHELKINLPSSKDQGEVRAHKIILAAQSEYFKVKINDNERNDDNGDD